MLKGKKILFFAPKFFNYEVEIKSEILKMGAIVHYYDERINPNNLEKFLVRKIKKIMSKKICKYYNTVIDEIQTDFFDYVLFISPETVTLDLMGKLKKKQSKAKFILYMWDSIKNKNAYSILPYFDKKYSFDKTDCELYGMGFRPLFFLNDYSDYRNNTEYKYDCVFLGTIHSDRFKILSKLTNNFSSIEVRSYFFLYFSNKIMFLLQRMTNNHFKENESVKFSFKSLPKKNVISLVSQSKAIIDIQHPNQLGLTMRTIEVLGMGKKIITTNEDIINYDFYNKKNIFIINRNNPLVDKDFFDSPYEEIPENIYNNYSISNWIKHVFK